MHSSPGSPGRVFVNKVQRHYDEIADIYDDRYDGRRGRSYHQHISDHVMSMLPKGGFLLDVGCGTGLFVKRYIEEGGQAVGLDISPRMVLYGRQRCPESGFCVGTADVLPFQDETFDALASLLAFSYVLTPGRCLQSPTDLEAWWSDRDLYTLTDSLYEYRPCYLPDGREGRPEEGWCGGFWRALLHKQRDRESPRWCGIH